MFNQEHCSDLIVIRATPIPSAQYIRISCGKIYECMQYRHTHDLAEIWYANLEWHGDMKKHFDDGNNPKCPLTTVS